MKRITIFLTMTAIVLIFANDIGDRFASPRNTFDTFINAVREKNKDLALLCFSIKVRNDIAQEWENEELPDSIWYEITAEETSVDEAMIEVTLWDDISERKVHEKIWFVPEEDGWKLVFERPASEARGFIDSTEK